MGPQWLRISSAAITWGLYLEASHGDLSLMRTDPPRQSGPFPGEFRPASRRVDAGSQPSTGDTLACPGLLAIKRGTARAIARCEPQ